MMHMMIMTIMITNRMMPLMMLFNDFANYYDQDDGVNDGGHPWECREL